MSSDYTDLTEMVAELLDKYTDDEVLLDLDAWELDDMRSAIIIFAQAIDLKEHDIEKDLMEAHLLSLDDDGEPAYDTIMEYEDDEAQRDLEAEYDDPLFLG